MPPIRTITIGCAMQALIWVGSVATAQLSPASIRTGRVVRLADEALPDGRKVGRWEVRNASGAGFSVMELGATITTLDVLDRAGRPGDVVFGFDRSADYLRKVDGSLGGLPYGGAVVGRFAGRIGGARFRLDGKTYSLSRNNGQNTLHGGAVGFDQRLWTGRPVSTREGSGVLLTLVSPAGEEGYPGRVQVSVRYLWTKSNSLIIDYTAMTTAATPFNISQHSYFNLAGETKTNSVLGHDLSIGADRMVEVDKDLIPTGRIKRVAGTPFDFRTAKPLGRDIASPDDQIRFGGGYDVTYLLRGSAMRKVATLTEHRSGRRLTVVTDQPALQLYSGNFLDGGASGKGGAVYQRRSAVVLETEHVPDSPNHAAFPDATLRPGKVFKSRTIFAFDVVR